MTRTHATLTRRKKKRTTKAKRSRIRAAPKRRKSPSRTAKPIRTYEDAIRALNRKNPRRKRVKHVVGFGNTKTPVCDIRKMRKIRAFDPPKYQYGARVRSQAMLERAKAEVLDILERNEKQHAQTGVPTTLEQAFLDASGEQELRFAYGRRKEVVRKARFGKKQFHGQFATDYGDTSKHKIVLNGNIPLTYADLRIVLLHEALHYFAERARPGNPTLTEEIEHMAMSILGDREEQVVYFDKHWNVDIANIKSSVAQRKRQRNP